MCAGAGIKRAGAGIERGAVRERDRAGAGAGACGCVRVRAGAWEGWRVRSSVFVGLVLMRTRVCFDLGFQRPVATLSLLPRALALLLGFGGAGLCGGRLFFLPSRANPEPVLGVILRLRFRFLLMRFRRTRPRLILPWRSCACIVLGRSAPTFLPALIPTVFQRFRARLRCVSAPLLALLAKTVPIAVPVPVPQSLLL